MPRLIKSFVAAALVTVVACKASDTPTSTKSADANNQPGLYHIVTLRFKNDAATLAQVPAQIKAFADLKTAALDPSGQPYLFSWTYGPNNSQIDVSFQPKKNADHSHEYVFVTTLANAKSRDLYIATPAHTAFLNGVIPYLDGGLDGGIFVSDFEPAAMP